MCGKANSVVGHHSMRESSRGYWTRYGCGMMCPRSLTRLGAGRRQRWRPRGEGLCGRGLTKDHQDQHMRRSMLEVRVRYHHACEGVRVLANLKRGMEEEKERAGGCYTASCFSPRSTAITRCLPRVPLPISLLLPEKRLQPIVPVRCAANALAHGEARDAVWGDFLVLHRQHLPLVRRLP